MGSFVIGMTALVNKSVNIDMKSDICALPYSTNIKRPGRFFLHRSLIVLTKTEGVIVKIDNMRSNYFAGKMEY